MIDLSSPRFSIKRTYNHQENRESWVVVDGTVADGVYTMQDTYGRDHHIFRPAAIKSAHYTREQASVALEAANAEAWGVTVEQVSAERKRRLYADITEACGLSVEEIQLRAEALGR